MAIFRNAVERREHRHHDGAQCPEIDHGQGEKYPTTSASANPSAS